MGLFSEPDFVYSRIPAKVARRMVGEAWCLYLSDAEREEANLRRSASVSKRNQVICKRKQEWIIFGSSARFPWQGIHI